MPQLYDSDSCHTVNFTYFVHVQLYLKTKRVPNFFPIFSLSQICPLIYTKTPLLSGHEICNGPLSAHLTQVSPDETLTDIATPEFKGRNTSYTWFIDQWSLTEQSTLRQYHCVVPKIIHTSPTEGIFPYTPPPLWKFQSSFRHLLKFWDLLEPPTPREFPIPSVGRVWIFSGTTQCQIILVQVWSFVFSWSTFCKDHTRTTCL